MLCVVVFHVFVLEGVGLVVIWDGVFDCCFFCGGCLVGGSERSDESNMFGVVILKYDLATGLK